MMLGSFIGADRCLFEKAFYFFHLTRIVLLPRMRVQDIDTLEDWEFAESLFAALKLVKSQS